MPGVVERILANWETTLRGISKANGYNNDIGKLDRFELGTMDQEAVSVVEIKRGAVTRNQGEYLGTEVGTVTIHNLVKVRHDPKTDGLSTDTIFESYEDDIYKAAMVDPTRGGNAFTPLTEFVSSQAVDVEEAGVRGAKDIQYQVTFRHAIGDAVT